MFQETKREKCFNMDIFATEVMQRNEYFAKTNFETVASLETYSTPRRRKKKNNGMNKRRFSDEQIKSLESIFYSSESKLDPRKKMQLAMELGLQPRQVAIWFQNRRARWKSKQTEKDLRSLKANYDNLASQFESLQEEKNSLLAQLQKLSELIQKKPHEDNSNNIGDTSCETEAKSSRLEEEFEQGEIMYMYNNQKAAKKWMENERYDQGLTVADPLEVEQECQFLDVNASSESSEKWCDFDLGGVIFENQTYSSLQWQNFWGWDK